MTDLAASCTDIELLVLDVDGVLTDGRITLTCYGGETKSFHVRDGAGLKLWRQTGRKVAIITGRGAEAVRLRAKELGVDAVYLNARDKLAAYEKALAKLGVAPQHTAAVGDDLADIPILRRSALPVAVADAVEEVKAVAAHVTQRRGGDGAVREVVEFILKHAGAWDDAVARYTRDSGEHA